MLHKQHFRLFLAKFEIGNNVDQNDQNEESDCTEFREAGENGIQISAFGLSEERIRRAGDYAHTAVMTLLQQYHGDQSNGKQ